MIPLAATVQLFTKCSQEFGSSADFNSSNTGGFFKHRRPVSGLATASPSAPNQRSAIPNTKPGDVDFLCVLWISILRNSPSVAGASDQELKGGCSLECSLTEQNSWVHQWQKVIHLLKDQITSRELKPDYTL